MLDASARTGTLVKLGKVWGDPTKKASTETEEGVGPACEAVAEKPFGSTSRLERRIADHTRSKCRQAQAGAEKRGTPEKQRAGGTRHVEALDGMYVRTDVKGEQKKIRVDREAGAVGWRVVEQPIIRKKPADFRKMMCSVDEVRDKGKEGLLKVLVQRGQNCDYRTSQNGVCKYRPQLKFYLWTSVALKCWRVSFWLSLIICRQN